MQTLHEVLLCFIIDVSQPVHILLVLFMIEFRFHLYTSLQEILALH